MSTTEWDQPEYFIHQIIDTGWEAVARLDSIAPNMPLRHDEPDEVELSRFLRHAQTAIEHRYAIAGERQLRAVSKAMSADSTIRVYERSPHMPFGLLTVMGVDSRGIDFYGDGLNIYGNPDKPYEVTDSYMRLQRGNEDEFSVVRADNYYPVRLRQARQRLQAVLDEQPATGNAKILEFTPRR